jgi:hypothetical protein
MIRTALALAALLAVSGCSQDPESAFPDASDLYRIEGADVFCDGGTVWYTEPEAPPYLAVACAWECLVVEGRDVRRVDVAFRRDGISEPWRVTLTGWYFGVCD